MASIRRNTVKIYPSYELKSILGAGSNLLPAPKMLFTIILILFDLEEREASAV